MINNQNRSKVFLVIIAILLIANIALLAFFLQKKGPDKFANRPDKKAFIANFLQKEIGFNQQQLVTYDSLSNQHREKLDGLYDSIRNIKTGQFKQLASLNFSDSAINAMADQSAASQKIIEIDMFDHIKGIRLLCTPGQLPKFDSLFIKVFNRRGEGRKKADK
jgi:hypothetical protein